MLDELLLEAEIASLEQKLKKLKHNPQTRGQLLGFWPGDSSKYHTYYYPHTGGKVLIGSDKDEYWTSCYNYNNSFKTEEDANRAGIRRETEALLWRNSKLFRAGECNWYFKLDNLGELVITYTKSIRLNIPYFSYKSARYLLECYYRNIKKTFV
jgi:hypothetical protein